jgi:hypothetical protein
VGNQPPTGSDMDRSNVSGSHSKRQAGIPSLVQAAPQLGHPSTPGVVDVFDNKPIRVKPRELRRPANNPAWRPAILRSWQGKPAVTTKASSEDLEAESVDLAKADVPPVKVSCSKCKSSYAAEQIEVSHSRVPSRRTGRNGM